MTQRIICSYRKLFKDFRSGLLLCSESIPILVGINIGGARTSIRDWMLINLIRTECWVEAENLINQ